MKDLTSKQAKIHASLNKTLVFSLLKMFFGTSSFKEHFEGKDGKNVHDMVPCIPEQYYIFCINVQQLFVIPVLYNELRVCLVSSQWVSQYLLTLMGM